MREHLLALRRVHHLRVELNRVKPLVRLLHRCRRAVVRVRRDPEARRHLGDIIRVAHPAGGLLRNSLEQRRFFLSGGRRIQIDVRVAVLTDGRGPDGAAQHVRHQLRAVADAEHRNAQLEELPAAGGRICRVDAVWSAGQDNPLRSHRADLFHTHRMRVNLTVHIAFADSAGDQLLILPAEIQH